MATVGDSLQNSVQLEDLPSPAFQHILQRSCSHRTPSICLLSRACKGLRATATAAAVPVHVQLGHRSPRAGDDSSPLTRQLAWSSNTPFCDQHTSGAPQQQHKEGTQQESAAARQASAITWLTHHAGIVQSMSICSEQEDPSSATPFLGALLEGTAAAAAAGSVRTPPSVAPQLRHLQLQGCIPLPSLTTPLTSFKQLQVLHLATPGGPLTFPTTRLSPETLTGLCTALSGLQQLKRLALQLHVHLPEGSGQQLVDRLPGGLEGVCLHVARPQQVSSSSFNRLGHLQQADLVYLDVLDNTGSSSSSSGWDGSNVGGVQQQEVASVPGGATQQQQGLAGLRSLSMKCHSPAALIPGAHNLQHLQLAGACAPATFKQLASCRQLRSLHLHHLHGPPDVAALSALTQLTRLRLETPGWLPAAATWGAALAALPALQQLEVTVEGLEQIPVATWLPYMGSLEVLVVLFGEGSSWHMEGLQGLAGVLNSTYQGQEAAGSCSLDSCSSMASASSREGCSSSSCRSSMEGQMGGGMRADSLSSEGTVVSMDWSVEGCGGPHRSTANLRPQSPSSRGLYSSSGTYCADVSCSNPTLAMISSSNNTAHNSTHMGAGLRLKELRLAVCPADPGSNNNSSSSRGNASSGPGIVLQAECLYAAAGNMQQLLPQVAVGVTSDACECPWWLGDEPMLSQ